jgi:hypothetical protein
MTTPNRPCVRRSPRISRATGRHGVPDGQGTDTASAAPPRGVVWSRHAPVVVQADRPRRAASHPSSPDAGPITPAIIYVAAERLAPGRIHHIHGGRLVVPTEHEAPIADAVGGGLRGTDDFLARRGELFANLVGNPITASRCGTWTSCDRRAFGTSRSILVEALAVRGRRCPAVGTGRRRGPRAPPASDRDRRFDALRPPRRAAMENSTSPARSSGGAARHPVR